MPGGAPEPGWSFRGLGGTTAGLAGLDPGLIQQTVARAPGAGEGRLAVGIL